MLSVLALTLLTSLLLGMRHATDPDHVIAVTTIVARERSPMRAAGIGALWGLGHTITVLAAGGAIILFKLAISPRVGLSMEFAVAVMLVALGIFNMAGGAGLRGSRDAASPASLPPLLVGTIHGLAGSAAATVFVLGLIPDPLSALAALVIFCLGTVGGMALVTVAIALPAAYANARVARMQRTVRFASGLLSAGFGLYLGHKIGFEDGLFTSTPQWTPQ